MLLIVDLSNNNGAQVDFEKLRRMGHVEGVMLKASEGVSFVDEDYHRFREDAHRAGLRVGAYHYARPDLEPHDPFVEADHFAAIVKGAGGLGRRDLRPALDYEQAVPGAGPWLAGWARGWCHRVRKQLGLWPLVYTYPAYAAAMDAKWPIGGGLWLASWGRNDGREYPYVVPAPWRHAYLHQFTSRAWMPGVPGNVDVSAATTVRPLLAHPIRGLR